MSNFNYYVSGVPDIDQRWATLPGEGSMYCFPTSVLNWIYYLRNHGFSNITFPDQFNLGDKVYNLLMMGSYMDTDKKEGTSLSDLLDGVEDRFDDFDVPAGICIRSMYSNDGVQFGVLKNWALMGGLMTLLRAKHNRIKVDPLKLRRKKKSGHMVTIVGLKENGSDRLIIVNDPAQGDSDLTRQSNKVEHNYPISSIKATFQKFDYDNNEVDDEEYANALRITESTDPYKIIEGYSVIFPHFTLTNTSNNELSFYSANLNNGGTNQVTIPMPFNGIADIAIKPGLAEAYVLQNNNSTVWKVNLATKEVTKFKEIQNANRIVFGGHKNYLHVVQNKTLRIISDDGNDRNTVNLDDVPQDISFDYKNNSFLALTKDKVIRLSSDLKLKDRQDVPGSLNGNQKMLINNRTGKIILSTKDKLSTIPPIQKSIVQRGKKAEEGKHIVVKNGVMEVVKDNGEKKKSIFNGLKAGSIVRMSESNLLVDPALASNEQYFY